jgi:heme exporter protein D
MIKNILSMDGNGIFVWLSFSITFVSCYFVYLKTKKTLKKYESEYANELEKLSSTKKQAILKKSRIANQILVSSKKTA